MKLYNHVNMQYYNYLWHANILDGGFVICQIPWSFPFRFILKYFMLYSECSYWTRRPCSNRELKHATLLTHVHGSRTSLSNVHGRSTELAKLTGLRTVWADTVLGSAEWRININVPASSDRGDCDRWWALQSVEDRIFPRCKNPSNSRMT